jgi:RNA polymerase III transcription factor (TF)IIIC subunit HTH domain/Tau95 Triple barrel domain
MRDIVIIEFPGILCDPSDVSAAMSALGGAHAVQNATRVPGVSERPSLNLTLRPGDLSSRSNIGSKYSGEVTNEFLMHISGDGEETTLDASSSNRQIVHTQIVSRITGRISFPGISDFQYFDKSATDAMKLGPLNTPPPPFSNWLLPSPPPGVVLLRNDSSNSSDRFKVSWREKSDLEHISDVAARVLKLNRDGVGEHDLCLVNEMRPARFSRTRIELGASESWFKQFLRGPLDPSSAPEKEPNVEVVEVDENRGRYSRLVSEDRRMAANRLESLPYRVDRYAEKIPEAASMHLELTPRLRAVVRYLEAKFHLRPIWSRRKLLCDAPDIVRRDFKASIPHTAYSFSSLTGPFHLLWIRYGFDPRVDVNARKYQVIEIRVKDVIVLEAMRQQWGSRMFQGTGEDLDVAGNFSVCELPCKRQLTLQLCDIDAPGLDGLLSNPENIQTNFDALTGYLTKRGVGMIVDHVKRRLRQHACKILGDAGVRNVLTLKRSGRRWKGQQGFGTGILTGSVNVARSQIELFDEDAPSRNVNGDCLDVDADQLASASIDFVAKDVKDNLDEMRRAAVAAAEQDVDQSESKALGVNQVGDECIENVLQATSRSSDLEVGFEHSSDEDQIEDDDMPLKVSEYALDPVLDEDPDSELPTQAKGIENNFEVQANMDVELIGDAENDGSVEGFEIYDEEFEDQDINRSETTDDDELDDDA